LDQISKGILVLLFDAVNRQC